MTYKEIIEKLKAYFDQQFETGGNEDYESSISMWANSEYTGKDLNLGEIKLVDSQGGCDKGSNWFRVHHFVNHDVYIKTSGYYSSYEGVNVDSWDENCSQVYPKSVMVQIYE